MKKLKTKAESLAARKQKWEAFAVEIQTGLDGILQALEDMDKDTNPKIVTDGKVD